MQCLCLILESDSVTQITEGCDRNPLAREIYLGRVARGWILPALFSGEESIVRSRLLRERGRILVGGENGRFRNRQNRNDPRSDSHRMNFQSSA